MLLAKTEAAEAESRGRFDELRAWYVSCGGPCRRSCGGSWQRQVTDHGHRLSAMSHAVGTLHRALRRDAKRRAVVRFNLLRGVVCYL